MSRRRLGSGLLLAGLLAALVTAGGCEDRHTWRVSEGEIVAWWIEDVAHGAPRRAEELELVDGSEEQLHLAHWALGSDLGGTRLWPGAISSRITRHPELASLAASGLIERTATGMLAPRQGISIDERDLVGPTIARENADRRELDALVLSLTDAQEDASQSYLHTVLAARAELDQEMGIPLAAVRK